MRCQAESDPRNVTRRIRRLTVAMLCSLSAAGTTAPADTLSPYTWFIASHPAMAPHLKTPAGGKADECRR